MLGPTDREVPRTPVRVTYAELMQQPCAEKKGPWTGIVNVKTDNNRTSRSGGGNRNPADSSSFGLINDSTVEGLFSGRIVHGRRMFQSVS